MGTAALPGATSLASSTGSKGSSGAPAAPRPRRWRRVALAVGATSVGLTAFVGFLHMPAARPLLARLGVKCPMGQASVQSVDMNRRYAAAQFRGADAAPARPAFTFKLDETTLTDVRSWTATAALDCAEDHPGLLHCHNVPAAAIGMGDAPSLDDLAFGFNPNGKLVNVTTFREHLDPASASRAAELAASTLSARLGPAKQTEGSFSPEALGRAPLASGSVNYRYRDYIAGVSAVNLGNANIAVREQYMSAVD